MPGSTRTFAYTLIPTTPGDTAKVAAKARKIMAYACDGDDRITCHGVNDKGVEGEPLGRVTLSMTITARDQWWCKQLAQDVLNLVTWGLGTQVSLDLRSARQPPHQQRGYGRGRTKTWRSRTGEA